MCLAWSCTSSSTNVRLGEWRSPSALPTVLRSRPLALSSAAAVADCAVGVAEHRVEDGGLAQIAGDPRVGDRDHAEPRILDLVRTTEATSSFTRSACRRTLAGSVISTTSAAKDTGSVDPNALTRTRESADPGGPARGTPGLLVIVTVQPAAHREQLDLGAAGHRPLDGVEDLARRGRPRRRPPPRRSRPGRAGRGRRPRRRTPRICADARRSAARRNAWPSANGSHREGACRRPRFRYTRPKILSTPGKPATNTGAGATGSGAASPTIGRGVRRGSPAPALPPRPG